jgi:6-carboxyhexanoate--CoA ligase
VLNIRMRASKEVRRRKSSDGVARRLHISGAEGICRDAEAGRVVEGYIRRAMEHSRGRPDRIDIAIERLVGRPRAIRALPVRTVFCGSPRTAQGHIRKILGAAGVSERAVDSALKIVFGDETMRGAAVVRAVSGERADPDRKRGIRASRLGIGGSAAVSLGRELGKQGIDIPTVVEAIVLASKVASCPQVVAELCVSDDPDYTTGYVSAWALGYVRIPHIKRKGDRRGGRVFFVEDDAEVNGVTLYLERRPVVVSRISECYGVCSIDEIIGQHHI